MTGRETSKPLGLYIRQLRRQHGLTQTQLGGSHFSKSYVSAMERGTLVPSYQAIRFFAEQLQQPVEDFERLLTDEQSDSARPPDGTATALINHSQDDLHELDLLLDLLLANRHLPRLPQLEQTTLLSQEASAALSPVKHAQYIFLQGMIAQEKGQVDKAIPAFEYALALLPARYHPMILDLLGNAHVQTQDYHLALHYHQRALSLIQQDQQAMRTLFSLVALHCGADCQALSAHQRACLYYEQARQHLNATYNIEVAGQLYLNLAYCTYAVLAQQGSTPDGRASLDQEQESAFQRSLALVLQSRVLYQAIHQRLGEARTRLMQAMILLDGSTWRRREVHRGSNDPRGLPISWLNDAQEQCQQVLLFWQDGSTTPSPTAEVENMIYQALAYLIEVYVQRAHIAHANRYLDTAQRELAIASMLCQQVLEQITAPRFSWSWIQTMLSSLSTTRSSQTAALPRLPTPFPWSDSRLHPLIQAEIAFATGWVAEELGQMSTSSDYAHTCTRSAEQCFQAGLAVLRQVIPEREHDASYLVRAYQRYSALLEERSTAMSDSSEGEEQEVFTVLKDVLTYLPESHAPRFPH